MRAFLCNFLLHLLLPHEEGRTHLHSVQALMGPPLSLGLGTHTQLSSRYKP